LSQAMSVQTTSNQRPEAASGGVHGPSAQKAAGKTGGFQALLSTLLSSMKKAAKGDDAKPAKNLQDGRSPGINRKNGQDDQVSAQQTKTNDSSKAARDAKTLSASQANAVQNGEKSLAEAKSAKKNPLSEELASNSRSHDALAAALGNNADFKAAKKDGEKPSEKENGATGIEGSSLKKKARIDLIDSRKAAGKTQTAGTPEEPAKSEEGAKSPKNESQLTIDLAPRGGQKPLAGEKTEAAQGQSFSARLASSLRDGYNAEIVKHSVVILRGDDSGIIRLNLKPESLGNVKVRLNLADNNITGTIIVESEAAKNAFEANIEHLAKSFIDSGFQDAKLQVSVDSGASGSGGGQARQEAPRDFSRAARTLDAAVPQIQAGGNRSRSGGLSVFA
jgi:flagellar hook-length control protein FliK